jgi:hypothetical protein
MIDDQTRHAGALPHVHQPGGASAPNHSSADVRLPTMPLLLDPMAEDPIAGGSMSGNPA